MSKLTAAFLTHYPDLIRYLRRRTHCSELAQDCAHDTWLRLLEKGKQVTADNHRAYVVQSGCQYCGGLVSASNT